MKHTKLSTVETKRLAQAGGANLSSLQRSMHAAEDNLAGLHRMLKVANIKAPRRTIKRSTQNSFYRSAAQIASHISNALSLAERIL